MKRSNQKERPRKTFSTSNESDKELNEQETRDRNTHFLLLAWQRVLASRASEPTERAPSSNETRPRHE